LAGRDDLGVLRVRRAGRGSSHRDCESIVDTADKVSSPLLLGSYDIIDVLAKDPKVRRELGNAYYDKWQKYRDDHRTNGRLHTVRSSG